jgi:hypothetical protein
MGESCAMVLYEWNHVSKPQSVELPSYKVQRTTNSMAPETCPRLALQLELPGSAGMVCNVTRLLLYFYCCISPQMGVEVRT